MTMWRVALWGTVAALLTLPAVAMQFTHEVQWGPGDFLFAAVLLGTLAALIDLSMRRARGFAHRIGGALAALTGFAQVWINSAVGIIGDGPNPWNFAFTAIPLLVLGLAIVLRFRPDTLWRVLGLAALATFAAALTGLGKDPRGAALAMLLTLPWLLSALLLRWRPADNQGVSP